MSEFIENDAELTLTLEGQSAGAIANNLTTTVEGYALDARQGKVLDDKKLDKSAVANNLTTIDEGKALDARQGKWLNENKVGFSDIANDLVTNDVNKVLSAAQGAAIKALVSAVESRLPVTGKPLAISAGGTNAGTAAKAREELGITPENIGAARLAVKTTAIFQLEGWTGDAAPYTNTVAVEGVIESDVPLVDLVLLTSDTTEEAVALRRENWALIDKIETGNGTLTAYSYTEVPTRALKINVQVVR